MSIVANTAARQRVGIANYTGCQRGDSRNKRYETPHREYGSLPKERVQEICRSGVDVRIKK